MESDRSFDLRLRERDRKLIHKVKDALAPLVDKNYRNRRSAAVGYIQGLPPKADA